MLRLCATLAALWLSSACALAAPPTAESVEELLRVTRSESLLDQTYTSVEGTMRQAIAQQIAGRTLSDEQRRLVELAPARLTEVMRSEFNWQKLRPIFVAIHQESLDQADVDGMLAFYKSPAGQALIAKMPAILQRTIGVVQLQTQALMPKLAQAMEQLMREAKLASPS